MVSNPAIAAKGLSKAFGSFKAVDGANLSIGKGELFGLLGPNGSGKTTIVRLLTGQLKPTSGSASILGVNPAKDPIKVRELVGIMPEQETPPSFLTAEEYLIFVAKIRRLDNPEGRAREWLDFFGFGTERSALCKDLSRGTRQKLMFSQAFIHNPAVAFIDEPLINLDPLVQNKVKDYMTGFVKRGGTILFCTHVLEVAERMCTSYAILHKGKVASSGKVRKGMRLDKIFMKAAGSGV
jgi:ABC-2 type transport system ATP-binding protein